MVILTSKIIVIGVENSGNVFSNISVNHGIQIVTIIKEFQVEIHRWFSRPQPEKYQRKYQDDVGQSNFSLPQITGGLQYNEPFILWANPDEMDNYQWKVIFPEKHYKQKSQSS